MTEIACGGPNSSLQHSSVFTNLLPIASGVSVNTSGVDFALVVIQGRTGISMPTFSFSGGMSAGPSVEEELDLWEQEAHLALLEFEQRDQE